MSSTNIKKQTLSTVMDALSSASPQELQALTKQMSTPAKKPVQIVNKATTDTSALANEVKAMVKAQFGNTKPDVLVTIPRSGGAPVSKNVKNLPAATIQALAEQITASVMDQLQPMSLAETAARNAKR